jgi:hypothetical protein
MSFFGNLKDLFGLNKSKKDERTKLNTLANQIQDFIKKQSNYSSDSNAEESYGNWCIFYISIADSLYTIANEICKTREHEHSDLANKLKSNQILNDNEINKIIKVIAPQQIAKQDSILNLLKVKNADEKKKLIENISKWFKKFQNVKGGHFTVWTSKIKKAIDDLTKIDASKIANVFIEKINVQKQKENEAKEKNKVEKYNEMYGKEYFEKKNKEMKDIEKIKGEEKKNKKQITLKTAIENCKNQTLNKYINFLTQQDINKIKKSFLWYVKPYRVDSKNGQMDLNEDCIKNSLTKLRTIYSSNNEFEKIDIVAHNQGNDYKGFKITIQNPKYEFSILESDSKIALYDIQGNGANFDTTQNKKWIKIRNEKKE